MAGRSPKYANAYGSDDFCLTVTSWQENREQFPPPLFLGLSEKCRWSLVLPENVVSKCNIWGRKDAIFWKFRDEIETSSTYYMWCFL